MNLFNRITVLKVILLSLAFNIDVSYTNIEEQHSNDKSAELQRNLDAYLTYITENKNKGIENENLVELNLTSQRTNTEDEIKRKFYKREISEINEETSTDLGPDESTIENLTPETSNKDETATEISQTSSDSSSQDSSSDEGSSDSFTTFISSSYDSGTDHTTTEISSTFETSSQDSSSDEGSSDSFTKDLSSSEDSSTEEATTEISSTFESTKSYLSSLVDTK